MTVGAGAVAARADTPRLSVARRRRLRLPFSPWHLLLAPASLILVFPFLWMIVTSIETSSESLHFPPILIPHQIRLQNYTDAFDAVPFVHFFLNSAIVASFTVVLTVVLSATAGYAFARLPFRGRGLIFGLLMVTLMVPFQVTMIPEFLITRWLGLHVFSQIGINHLGALVLPNVASAFGILFFRQFFRTLPIEYEEAARIDGASRVLVLLKIVLPLALPAVATLAALSFLTAWNDFLWPLIVIDSSNMMTLPLGLSYFQGSHTTEWTLLMAGNVMSLVPMVAVFISAQRYFVRSVAETGLGGA